MKLSLFISAAFSAALSACATVAHSPGDQTESQIMMLSAPEVQDSLNDIEFKLNEVRSNRQKADAANGPEKQAELIRYDAELSLLEGRHKRLIGRKLELMSTGAEL